VLIVEDQANWRNALQLALQDRCFIQSAASLVEARGILFEHRQPFHVVVVDIRLDDTDPSNEDGLALADEIEKRLNGFTKTVAVTAYPSVSSVKRALRAGVFEYVEKYPQDGSRFDLAAFRRLIQRAARTAARTRGEQVPPRALIIEDESGWQETLGTMLKGEGFEIDVTDSHLGAENRIREQIYDLFVVDLRLGDASPDRGMDLVSYIEEHSRGAKVIIVTGFATLQRIHAVFAEHKSSVEDFFAKDEFDRRTFLNAARRAISSPVPPLVEI
jgi:DNA-binding NtrC family response regulator